MKRIPSRPDEVTPSWLTEQLRRNGALKDTAVAKVKPTAVSLQGQLSNVYRLVLTYDEVEPSAPSSLVVKFGDFQDNPAWTFLYENEYRFYDEFAGADAGVSFPRCYYANFDRASGVVVFLLEDLSGGRLGSCFKTSIADVKAALVQIGRFHARWWNDPRVLGSEWVQKPWESRLVQRETLSELIRLTNIRYPEHFRGYMKDAATALEGNLVEYRDYWKGREMTLNHGDLNPFNIYYGVDDTRSVVFFDWQCLRAGSPAIDVTRLMLDGLTAKQMSTDQQHLMEIYHESLSVAGVRSISQDQLLLDIRLNMLSHLVFVMFWANYTDVENVARAAKQATGSDWRDRFFRDVSEILEQNQALEALELL